MKYFLEPPPEPYRQAEEKYLGNCRTYTEYNYLRPGLASTIRKRHFEAALKFAEPFFGQAEVIDMGCADGIFLPSLARYFPAVIGVDNDPAFIRTAHQVVEALGADHVTPICNQSMDFAELKKILPEGNYQLLFLLEVLEHIGEADRLYKSKLDFLRQCAGLLSGPEPRIIVSVPKMVGLAFMIQRFGLWAMKQRREPISWQQFWRVGLLRDTDELEKTWDGGHLGFNHHRLEESWAGVFDIVSRRSLPFQIVYSLKPLG